MAGKTRVTPYGETTQGDLLFTARRRLGLSQDEMADRCDMTRILYRACEAGNNQITGTDSLQKLATGFGVTMEVMHKYLHDESLSQRERDKLLPTRVDALPGKLHAPVRVKQLHKRRDPSDEK